jgi:Response regulator containing CheY-like receiver, AAA-type ATPase, and DNA-binding domains
MVRVLLVDDDAAIRETLATILRADEVEVTTCDCAAKAAGLIASGGYDIIITDMRMETPTSGSDVIRAANASSSSPRVVVLTAFPLPRNNALTAGASAVLLKGTDTGSLISKIRNVVAEVASRKPHSRTA